MSADIDFTKFTVTHSRESVDKASNEKQRETRLAIPVVELRYGDDGSSEELYRPMDAEVKSEMALATKQRDGWDNKLQFLFSVISYAVGLGNIWRFPYLLQQNGGGAFLIPYCVMMLLEGMPVFLLEMGIGQKLRCGPIGVWNTVHPYLGGVGISSSVVSLFVGLYYNVIITWCLFYLFNCFQDPLPWKVCPSTVINGSTVPDQECEKSSETTYFWYRTAINASAEIGEFSAINWRLAICLVAAWFIVWICVCKGIRSSGKVMYVTATFPYVVMMIFFVRSIMLPGALKGCLYMFVPQLHRLSDARVWLDAAAQIFYSLGLAFGGLIAFGSYNPTQNNCKRDVVILSATNLATSVFSALIVFAILGFKGQMNTERCVSRNLKLLGQFYPQLYPNASSYPGWSTFQQWSDSNFTNPSYPLLQGHATECEFATIMTQVAEGTGLAFIAFAQAIVEFPYSQLWAVLFFLMLLSLGLGSMFGTLEGIITSIYDLKLFPWLSKPVLTGILCSVSCACGLVFVTRAGEYWVKLFDTFSGSYALLAVALFEVIAVAYVYGWQRFSSDLFHMTGSHTGRYWQLSWRFFSPAIMALLLLASFATSVMEPLQYQAYNSSEAKAFPTPYPPWALIFAGFLVTLAVLPIPFVFFIRYFKLSQLEEDIPTAARVLNSTPSTAAMLASQVDLKRLDSEVTIQSDSDQNEDASQMFLSPAWKSRQ